MLLHLLPEASRWSGLNTKLHLFLLAFPSDQLAHADLTPVLFHTCATLYFPGRGNPITTMVVFVLAWESHFLGRVDQGNAYLAFHFHFQ